MADGADDIDAFIDKWARSSAGERSNFQSFLNELCDLLGVPKPDVSVADESRNAYVFERTVKARRLEGRDAVNFIDLYRRGCFVMEAKQSRKRVERLLDLGLFREEGEAAASMRVGSGKRGGPQWDAMMRSAREQAESYAKNLPPSEGWPPFLVVVDVGHVIELYADFSLQGKHYAQFPDRQSYRIYLEDLRDEAVRARLRQVWEDPLALNPARRTAEVTREIAALLARLSKRLERRLAGPEAPPHQKRAVAEKTALFLMRCLFTMFAEDVRLLAPGSFTRLLADYKGKADRLHHKLAALWRDMDSGGADGWSAALDQDILRFNGKLFKDAEAIPIDEDELDLLHIAAQRDWKDVEPAIFGTLLEQALDPAERHQLGAHYTPRAYVERLVTATVIDPLTEDWKNVRLAAALLREAGKEEDARAEVRAFHLRLCKTRILDPACGTGNFLYVALELMKRLEGEVLELLADLGEQQHILELDRHTVDPHQFLGLEVNPRAVAIAELVLWIGYLQWHFRTRGKSMPAQPVLKNFANIQEKDAILAHSGREILRDEQGRPRTRWDGISFKPHPVTGADVPDDAGRIELYRYKSPKPADWPAADFVIGNPPFIGGKDMRQELGDGYAEACWAARPYIPGGADFVMHFWDKAAELVRTGKARRFGLITTNSITQTFSRRVIERHLGQKKPLSLALAIPDHPWLKGADRAAVRIAMTVGVPGDGPGLLQTVVREDALNSDAPKVALTSETGKIWSNLRLGADLSAAVALKANDGVCSPGVKLHGAGFIVTPEQARALGLGKRPGLESHILNYRNGRDLTARPRGVMVIDLYPLAAEDVQTRFPEVFQWVADHVKPERDSNREAFRRRYWWWFGRTHKDLRAFLHGLSRYIATVETSKHRFFQFLDADVRPDNMLVNIASDDAFHLGVLSSRLHAAWALAMGGTLEDRPRYNKTRCFDPFPFPDATAAQAARIRELGERLDGFRKERLAAQPHLTMTGLYNVLEKRRAGAALSDAEKDVNEAGQVAILQQIHDDLDAAVAAAYGWPADLSEAALLERLVALNAERAAEERAGHARWLRPDFQAPKEAAAAAKAEQIEADLGVAAQKAAKPKLPKALPDQMAAVRGMLLEAEAPQSAQALARRFAQGKRAEPKVAEILASLALLGHVEKRGERYVSSD
eukprot:g877.t1